MHRKFQLRPQLPQQLDIPAPLVAEDKIRPDAQALDAAQVARQPPNERLAGLLAERLVEVDQQQRVGAQRFDRAQLLRQGIDQRRHPAGGHHRVRVPIKRDHQPNRLVLFGVGEGLPDDLLVPQVHAVKEADGQADLAACGPQLIGGVDDSHVFSYMSCMVT